MFKIFKLKVSCVCNQAFVFQAETVNIYHVGETILSLQRAVLIPGGSESLVYTTLSGGVGMMLPFTSREVCADECFIKWAASVTRVVLQNEYNHCDL